MFEMVTQTLRALAEHDASTDVGWSNDAAAAADQWNRLSRKDHDTVVVNEKEINIAVPAPRAEKYDAKLQKDVIKKATNVLKGLQEAIGDSRPNKNSKIHMRRSGRGACCMIHVRLQQIIDPRHAFVFREVSDLGRYMTLYAGHHAPDCSYVFNAKCPCQKKADASPGPSARASGSSAKPSGAEAPGARAPAAAQGEEAQRAEAPGARASAPPSAKKRRLSPPIKEVKLKTLFPVLGPIEPFGLDVPKNCKERPAFKAAYQAFKAAMRAMVPDLKIGDGATAAATAAALRDGGLIAGLRLGKAGTEVRFVSARGKDGQHFSTYRFGPDGELQMESVVSNGKGDKREIDASTETAEAARFLQLYDRLDTRAPPHPQVMAQVAMGVLHPGEPPWGQVGGLGDAKSITLLIQDTHRRLDVEATRFVWCDKPADVAALGQASHVRGDTGAGYPLPHGCAVVVTDGDGRPLSPETFQPGDHDVRYLTSPSDAGHVVAGHVVARVTLKTGRALRFLHLGSDPLDDWTRRLAQENHEEARLLIASVPMRIQYAFRPPPPAAAPWATSDEEIAVKYLLRGGNDVVRTPSMVHFPHARYDPAKPRLGFIAVLPWNDCQTTNFEAGMALYSLAQVDPRCPDGSSRNLLDQACIDAVECLRCPETHVYEACSIAARAVEHISSRRNPSVCLLAMQMPDNFKADGKATRAAEIQELTAMAARSREQALRLDRLNREAGKQMEADSKAFSALVADTSQLRLCDVLFGVLCNNYCSGW